MLIVRNWNLLRAGDWFPRFLPAFFYLWLERKRTRSEVTDTFWKSRKNPPVICMLIRVPLFTNSNCTSNSWGTNFGSEMDIHASLLQYSSRSVGFILWRIRLLVFVPIPFCAQLSERSPSPRRRWEQKEKVTTHTYSSHLLVPKG